MVYLPGNMKLTRYPERETPRDANRFRRREHIGNCLIVTETVPLTATERALLNEEDAHAPMRKLTSLMAFSPGRQAPYDLLKLINPTGVPIFMHGKPAANYSAVQDEACTPLYLTCPPLKTGTDIAALFHEAGHTQQSTDPEMRQLNPYYRVGDPRFVDIHKTTAQRQALYETALRIIDICPELEKHRDTLLEQRDLYELAETDRALAEKQRPAAEHRREELFAEIDALREQSDALIREDFSPLIDKVEAVLRAHDLPVTVHPSPKPLPHAVKASIWRAIRPYGLELSEEHPLYTDTLPLFLSWVRDKTNTPVTGELENSTDGIAESFYANKDASFLVRLHVSPDIQGFSEERMSAYKQFSREQERLDDEKNKIYDNLHRITQALRPRRLERFAILETVLRHPRQLLERDATWRALLWLRHLQKTEGISLIADPSETIREILPELLRCLDSYKASVDRFRKVAWTHASAYAKTAKTRSAASFLLDPDRKNHSS